MRRIILALVVIFYSFPVYAIVLGSFCEHFSPVRGIADICNFIALYSSSGQFSPEEEAFHKEVIRYYRDCKTKDDFINRIKGGDNKIDINDINASYYIERCYDLDKWIPFIYDDLDISKQIIQAYDDCFTCGEQLLNKDKLTQEQYDAVFMFHDLVKFYLSEPLRFSQQLTICLGVIQKHLEYRQFPSYDDYEFYKILFDFSYIVKLPEEFANSLLNSLLVYHRRIILENNYKFDSKTGKYVDNFDKVFEERDYDRDYDYTEKLEYLLKIIGNCKLNPDKVVPLLEKIFLDKYSEHWETAARVILKFEPNNTKALKRLSVYYEKDPSCLFVD